MATRPKLAFSVLPTGIRAKLTWAALLMSCTPLVVLIVLVGWFVFPYTREIFPWLDSFFIDPRVNPSGGTWWLWAVLALTALVSLLGGVYLTVKVVRPVLQVSHEAKLLAEDPLRPTTVSHQEDELGVLTDALNRLTGHIRENMQELQQFGERTTQINADIHRRMTMLASLLQVSELIGKSGELDAVLNLIVERLATVEELGFGVLYLQPGNPLNLASVRSHQLDGTRLSGVSPHMVEAVIDAHHAPLVSVRPLWEVLGKPNLVVRPIPLRGQPIGILVLGTHQPNYRFTPELIDFVSVFSKQVSLALENELLLRKNKALAVRDELTGLYNEAYIRQRLEEEIKRAIAYQRPCALAMFTVDRFGAYRSRRSEVEAEGALKRIARVIQDSVTEIDRVGRFNNNRFAVLLPERNKREALEIAEAIRQRVEYAFASAQETEDRLTISGSVAENPLDGVTAEDLLSKSSAQASVSSDAIRNRVVAS